MNFLICHSLFWEKIFIFMLVGDLEINLLMVQSVMINQISCFWVYLTLLYQGS